MHRQSAQSDERDAVRVDKSWFLGFSLFSVMQVNLVSEVSLFRKQTTEMNIPYRRPWFQCDHWSCVFEITHVPDRLA